MHTPPALLPHTIAPRVTVSKCESEKGDSGSVSPSTSAHFVNAELTKGICVREMTLRTMLPWYTQAREREEGSRKKNVGNDIF